MNKLQLSVLISTFAGCLLWTGFPLFYQSLYGSDYSIPQMYLYAVTGSLLFSLVGGLLADRADYRRLAVGSQMLSVAFLIAIICMLAYPGALKPIWFMVPMYFNFSLYQVSEATWLINGDGKTELRSKIIDRTRLLLIAKIGGFGLGPVLFMSSGKASLLFCIAVFLISIILQIQLIQKQPGRFVKSGVLSLPTLLKGLAKEMSRPLYVIAAIVTGMTSVPLNAVVIQNLVDLKADTFISPFWIAAGVASFLVIFLIKRHSFLSQKGALLPVSLVLCAVGGLMFQTTDPKIIVLLSATFIGLSAIFPFFIQHYVCEAAENDRMGTALGTYGFFIDSGVQLGMAAASIFTFSAMHFTLALAALIILRLFCLVRLT